MRNHRQTVMAGILSLWGVLTIPVAAQQASSSALVVPPVSEQTQKWHAACVRELKSKFSDLKDEPFSISIGQGGNLSAITVGQTRRLLARTNSECAERLAKAFRMIERTDVDFTFNNFDPIDYVEVRCQTRLHQLAKPDSSIKGNITRILVCINDKGKLNLIKSWVPTEGWQDGQGGFRNIDLRFFNLLFAKSEICQDRSDIQDYYRCLANEIVKDDGRREVVQNSAPPVAAPAEASQRSVLPVTDSGGADLVGGREKNAGTSPIGPTPSDLTSLGETFEQNPPNDGKKGQLARPLVDILTDYSLIVVIVSVGAIALFIIIWLALKNSTFPGFGVDKVQAAKEQMDYRGTVRNRPPELPNSVGKSTVQPATPPAGLLSGQTFEDERDAQKAENDRERAIYEKAEAGARLYENPKIELQSAQWKIEELTRREREYSEENRTLRAKCLDLDNKLKFVTEERHQISAQLDYFKSQQESLESGLPAFLSPSDLNNPLTAFWIRAAKSSPQSHSRLEGALRSYKITSVDPEPSGSRIFDLVNDIGLQLYGLMDTMRLDESDKRDEAARWQAALNKDGRGKFLVSVLYAGTSFELPLMMRKDERVKSERITKVCGWVVKDKEDRIARRAMVE